MCCKTEVIPSVLPPGVDWKKLCTAVAYVAGFEKAEMAAIGDFRRDIDSDTPGEQDTRIYMKIEPDKLVLRMFPQINSTEGHHHKHTAAGLVYEVAARTAEKCNGTIMQFATVADCIARGAPADHVIAHYPDHPLRFEDACPGFQDAILGD